MKDMMNEIYEALCMNSFLAAKVGSKRIKYFELDESFDTTQPFIILDVLEPQHSAYFAGNKVMAKTFSYQLNVESHSRLLTKEISKSVEEVMRDLGFGQLTGGLDTYFEETKRFVDARRYRKNTNIHDTNY